MPDHDLAALIKEHRVLLEYAVKDAIAEYQAGKLTGGIHSSDDSVAQPNPIAIQAVDSLNQGVKNEQH